MKWMSRNRSLRLISMIWDRFQLRLTRWLTLQSLYETDTKVPLDPITESDYESADEMDHTDVDGDDE